MMSVKRDRQAAFGKLEQVTMGHMQVITSALSLARELWRYGEPDLADQALRLGPEQVADIGFRTGQLLSSEEADRLWPGGPRGDKAILLAAIEQLEGHARPCARNRRLPEKMLPAQLQATEAERLDAAQEVAQVVTRRNAGLQQ
jgi:hypothetical protein